MQSKLKGKGAGIVFLSLVLFVMLSHISLGSAAWTGYYDPDDASTMADIWKIYRVKTKDGSCAYAEPGIAWGIFSTTSWSSGLENYKLDKVEVSVLAKWGGVWGMWAKFKFKVRDEYGTLLGESVFSSGFSSGLQWRTVELDLTDTTVAHMDKLSIEVYINKGYLGHVYVDYMHVRFDPASGSSSPPPFEP
ncbi:MAG: hypothetical protein ACFFBD_15655 [Candidatus Hodarchaeota archaeon]